jgi:hypothetical protein
MMCSFVCIKNRQDGAASAMKQASALSPTFFAANKHLVLPD